MLVGSADGPLGHVLGQDQFGFSIRHAFKRVGHGITSAGKRVGHGITSAGKEAGHLAVKGVKLNLKLITLPAMELEKHVLAPALRFVLTPVRHKVDTLKTRRANKLAFDRHHPVPTPQDKNDARAWAKSYLKREVPPFGLMLSLLAGPPPMMLGRFHGPSGGSFGDPATATIIASVPTLLAIIDKVLTRSNKSGDAPAHAGGGGGASAGGGAAPDAGGDAGGDAADSGGDDGSGSGDGGGGKGKHGGHGGKGGGGKMMLPGIGAVPKTAVYVGGGLLALVLLVAITKKKS